MLGVLERRQLRLYSKIRYYKYVRGIREDTATPSVPQERFYTYTVCTSTVYIYCTLNTVSIRKVPDTPIVPQERLYTRSEGLNDVSGKYQTLYRRRN